MLVLVSSIASIAKEIPKGNDLFALIVGRQGIQWINVTGYMDFSQGSSSRTNPWPIRFLTIR